MTKTSLMIFSSLLMVIMIAGFAMAAQLPVDLGTAGDYVILSKTGISTTGTTAITGDIGVSPIDSTAITGFGLIADSSNEFSTSSLLTGKAYASDYTSPTPSILTTAINDMQTAYSDAAGRTNPTATEVGAGEIGGMTLTPGLYKWGTGVSISTDVTLNGGENDVWIFQIAENLMVADGKKVVLTGGAQAKNIFWQVGSNANIGTTAQFNGNILTGTDINLRTGAILNGRALSQTAVTLDANTITTPGTSTSTTSTDTTSTTDSGGSSSSSTTNTEENTGSTTETTEDIVSRISLETELSVSLSNENTGSKLRVQLSNGNYASIRVLPSEASDKAESVLGVKCSEETNCTVELKEHKVNGTQKAVYEVKMKKEVRLFGIFKVNQRVGADIDAETKEVITTHKSWWSFLTTEIKD